MKVNRRKLGLKKPVSCLIALLMLGSSISMPMATVKAAGNSLEELGYIQPKTDEEQWGELQSILSKAKGVVNGAHTSGVRTTNLTSGQLLGNGDIGVVSEPLADRHNFLISKSDFWNNWDNVAQSGSLSGARSLEQKLTFGGITLSTGEIAEKTYKAWSPQSKSAAMNGYLLDGLFDPKWEGVKSDEYKYIYIDFGKEITFDQWKIYHNSYSANGDLGSAYSQYNTRDFNLQRYTGPENPDDAALENDENYEVLDTVTDNTANMNATSFDKDITARYVRVVITKPHNVANNQFAAVREIEFYKSGAKVVPDSASASSQGKNIQNIEKSQIESAMNYGGVDVKYNTWVSDSKNLIITEVLTDELTSPVSLDVKLWVQKSPQKGDSNVNVTHDFPATSGVIKGGEGESDILYATRRNTEKGMVDYRENAYNSQAAAALKIIGASAEGTVDLASNSGEEDRFKTVGSTLRVQLTPGEPVYIVTSMTGDGYVGPLPDKQPFIDEAVSLLDVVPAELSALYQEHIQWWKDYWMKSYVTLEDSRLMQYYYGSLYMLGCAYREGHIAPGLYGSFNPGDYAGWGSRYTMNYNFQTPLYGVYAANRMELDSTYIDTILSAVPFGRNNAASAGYNGIFFPRTINRITMAGIGTDTPEPVEKAETKDHTKLYTDQAFLPSMSIPHFIWHYEYGGDETFLSDTLYPLLKEIGEFWMDFPELGEDGKYHILHSAANEGGDDVDTTIDIGFMTLVLKSLIKYSDELGVDKEKQAQWQYYLDNIMPISTGTNYSGYEGKPLIELAYEINNSIKGNAKINKRDQPIAFEGLYFPSELYGIGSDPEILEMSVNTFKYMDIFSNSGLSSENGFSKTYPIAARMGWEVTELLSKFKACINKNFRTSNLTRYTSGGGIETAGSIETIHSVLLQSTDDIIRVFPNWTDESATKAAFTNLRAKGAFLFTSQITENGSVSQVDIQSEAGNRLNVVIPWDTDSYDTYFVNTATGEAVPYELKKTPYTNEDYLSVETTAGGRYALIRGTLQFGVPEAPVNLTVSDISSDSISLQWEMNPNEVDTPVYEVRYVAGDAPIKTIETKDTTAVLSGLSADTSYQISVYARYGADRYSEECAALTVVTPPASAQHPVILRADNPNAVRNQKIGVTKEELSAALPGTVSAWVYDDANGAQTVDVPVSWDVSGIDTASTAVQAVPGTIVLENGMQNPHNLSVTLSIRLHNNSVSFTKESMSYNQKLNLTELGAADWVQVSKGDSDTSLSIERKNTNAPKISDIQFTSDATGSFGPIAGLSDWAILTKWSDGTNLAESDPAPATNSIGAGKGAGLRYVGNCYEFTVEGQPYEQELILSLGAWQSLSRLTVSFEDGSEVFVTDTVDSKVDKIGGGLATAHYNNKGAKLFTIKFKATEPGERITVRYGAEKSYATNEQATFQAAMLRRTPGSDIKSELRTLYEANKDKAQGNYTDATWTEFQNALEAAKTVLDNESATEAQVNEALEALQAAVGALSENTAKDIADGITEITAPAKGAEKLILPTVPEGFTVSIKSSSNEAVIDLEGNITPPALDTEVKLVLSVSKGDDTAETRELTVTVPGVGMWKILLKQTIDAAELKAENLPEHIIPAVKEKFLAALRNAKTLYAKADATDEELKNADDLLITMMHYLAFTANPEDLQKAVDEADGIIASGKYVADKAFEDYKALRDEAKALLLDEAATDTEYGDMIAKLAEAKAKLTLKPVETLDLSVLEHQINLSQDAYNNLSKYFDGEAKEAFKAAYEKAVQVLEDARKPGTAVTQVEVNKAAEDLHKARPGLRLIPNKAELENLLNRANAKDLSKYTKESGAVLLTAIDMAQAVYDNPLATVEQVKVAEAVLNAAMDNLVPIKNGGAEEPGNKPGDGNDTPTGDSTPIGLVSFGILALGACLVLRKKK